MFPTYAEACFLHVLEAACVSYQSSLQMALVGYFGLCMKCVGKFPTKVPEDFSLQYKSDHNFSFVVDMCSTDEKIL